MKLALCDVEGRFRDLFPEGDYARVRFGGDKEQFVDWVLKLPQQTVILWHVKAATGVGFIVDALRLASEWPRNLNGVLLFGGTANADCRDAEEARKLTQPFGGRVHILSYSVPRQEVTPDFVRARFGAFAATLADLECEAIPPFEILESQPWPRHVVAALIVCSAYAELSAATQAAAVRAVQWESVTAELADHGDDGGAVIPPASEEDCQRLVPRLRRVIVSS